MAYAKQWQEELAKIELERAHFGIFPREFAFSHDWEKLLDEIAADVVAKAREKKRQQGPLIVLLGGGGCWEIHLLPATRKTGQ